MPPTRARALLSFRLRVCVCPVGSARCLPSLPAPDTPLSADGSFAAVWLLRRELKGTPEYRNFAKELSFLVDNSLKREVDRAHHASTSKMQEEQAKVSKRPRLRPTLKPPPPPPPLPAKSHPLLFCHPSTPGGAQNQALQCWRHVSVEEVA